MMGAVVKHPTTLEKLHSVEDQRQTDRITTPTLTGLRFPSPLQQTTSELW